MATMKAEREYKCSEGCDWGNCSGHKIEITIQNTSDVMCIKHGEKEMWFDPESWEQVKDILQGWDYSGFDLKARVIHSDN